MPLNEWNADPDKYKRLAEPFQDRLEAQRACNAFIDELAALREKYHIPELCCQLVVYVKTETPDGEGGKESIAGGAGWGNQIVQARMARAMADRETDAALDMIQNLAARTDAVARLLITDPKGTS